MNFLVDFLSIKQYTPFDMGQIKGTFNTTAELNNTLQSFLTLKKNSAIEVTHFSSQARTILMISEDETIVGCTMLDKLNNLIDSGHDALFATMLWPHGDFLYETKKEIVKEDILADERKFQKLAMASMTVLKKHCEYYEKNTYITINTETNIDINKSLLFSITQIKNSMNTETMRYKEFIKLFNPISYEQFDIIKTITESGIVSPAEDSLIQNERLYQASQILGEYYKKAEDIINSNNNEYQKIETLFGIVMDYIKKQYTETGRLEKSDLDAIIAEASLDCDTPLHAEVSMKEFKYTKEAIKSKNKNAIISGGTFLGLVMKKIESIVGFISEAEWEELVIRMINK